jgi:hypothetical protein
VCASTTTNFVLEAIHQRHRRAQPVPHRRSTRFGAEHTSPWAAARSRSRPSRTTATAPCKLPAPRRCREPPLTLRSTFLKRKGGLFKKAHELSVLCSVDVAVIIFGHNKKLYEFSSGDINDTIGRYQYVCTP